MNGNCFILKRVYLERNQEREYKSHVKRLEKIKTTSVNLAKKIEPIDKQLAKSNKNHIKSQQFKEIEKLREEKVTNKALIDKLVEINDGKFSVARQKMNNGNQTEKAGTAGTLGSSSQKKISSGLGQASKSQKSSMFVGSLNTIGRKLNEEKVARENHSLAQRMINLPPVISKNRQEKDYKQAKELKNRILRFHVLKPKPEKKYKRMQYDDFGDDDDEEYDPNDEKLMNQKVQMVIGLKDIKFINFLPQNDQNEKYFLEIKASIKPMRETIPETYEDFSQSVINEFFYLKELKKSKLVYVGLYQTKGGKKTFLGDFELDLSPFFDNSCFHDIHYDLRNYKELRTMPNYMHKDMRKKGTVDFYLQITSNIKTFNLKQKAKKEAEGGASQPQQEQGENEKLDPVPTVAEN